MHCTCTINLEVCSVFRKGTCKYPSNDRAVSQMFISCTVMESTIASSLLSFLRTHGLILHDQFGFLTRRSAYTHLLATWSDWTLNEFEGGY